MHACVQTRKSNKSGFYSGEPHVRVFRESLRCQDYFYSSSQKWQFVYLLEIALILKCKLNSRMSNGRSSINLFHASMPAKGKLHFATTKIAIKVRLRAAKINPSRIDWTVIDPKHGMIIPMKKRSVA